MAAKMCLDESMDILSSIANPAADSDERAATSVSTFAVERAYTAAE
jgi:hypothetical protein